MTTSQVEYGIIEVAAHDERRIIEEFNFLNCSVQLFKIKSSKKPLGQHFHKKKFEIFYFLRGGGKVLVERVEKNGSLTGERKKIKIKKGSLIRIPPFHTHRLDLRPGTHVLCFSSKPFNPENTDLHPCPIEY